MIYKTYGNTGKRISVLAAGGMRHAVPEDTERSAETLLRAYQAGVNYFDTAPGYCEDRSETITGRALRQMKPGTYHVATKSMKSDGSELREQLERSLERLGVDRIDFFHIWCLLDREKWIERKRGRAVDAALRAREEGLIEHLCFSTHMGHHEADEVIEEGIFDGVLLGYNALNFPLREATVRKAQERGMGVMAMNPLAGGLIPEHPESFDFLRDGADPDVVTAALRFVCSAPGITGALVGFRGADDVDTAAAALEDFRPYSQEHMDRLKERIRDRFEGFCTGCGYCLPCPSGVPIPKLMDAANVLQLENRPGKVVQRLRMHWGLSPEEAGKCTQCGQCEQACTQHLPIIERLNEVADLSESTE
ncbi:aldo/keto reductase [Kiritimatiella glycovorans]|uniref:Oxidoreductases of the aldo/keto reductase family n=1 Tax=Kiritimatiella glycovorans TaxID=1307763 RepID=A0A0G3EHD4_9BACT|nr:aldo/keto reductase [Kiritimatiella glycovorans]AKJ64250.1 Putative oxidoreductases of the aldo/keto reductase family [Kiritimatiella glycovorans]